MNIDASTLKWLLLAILALGYLLDTVMDLLNLSGSRKGLPDELRDIYNPERYSRSIAYHAERTRFGILTGTAGFILVFLMVALGGFGWLDSFLRSFTGNQYWLAVLFFGAIMIASDILTLPFQLYRTFVIEEKYGFNRMDVKTFFTDKLKSYLLGAVIGIPVLLLLIYLLGTMGSDFWWIFWIVAGAIMIFMNTFYTTLIIPLFNTLTPLEDGELKQAIQAYCSGVSFPLTNIYIIDGSRRSSRSNAFFSGLGRRKKVVLYDTLIKNHSTEELVAILAHEIGHYKKHHIIKGMVLALLQTGLMLFIMSRVIFTGNFSAALGGGTYALHLNLLAFTLLYSPVSTLSGIIMNIISRRHEYQADAFAAGTYLANAMKLALKKLSSDNMSNLYPHPAYVFVNYSHPPILKRLKAIDQTPTSGS